MIGLRVEENSFPAATVILDKKNRISSSGSEKLIVVEPPAYV